MWHVKISINIYIYKYVYMYMNISWLLSCPCSWINIHVYQQMCNEWQLIISRHLSRICAWIHKCASMDVIWMTPHYCPWCCHECDVLCMTTHHGCAPSDSTLLCMDLPWVWCTMLWMSAHHGCAMNDSTPLSLDALWVWCTMGDNTPDVLWV